MTPYYDKDGITIYHGDCREMTEWLGADVLVMDPPYGESHASNWNGPFKGQQIANDCDSDTRDSILDWWGGRPAVVFGKWSVAKWGKPRGVLAWDKGPASGMGDLSFPWKASWEDVAIYGKGWQGHRDEGVLRGKCVVTWSGKGQRLHPNEKPTWLLRHIIEKAPCGTILDPFMGSGTTIVAAKELGRTAIGIEIEERYCEIAAKRLAQGILPFTSNADVQ